ncbi:MAG: FtsX-like permease family protein [Gemmatimonadaceae bacterium]
MARASSSSRSASGPAGARSVAPQLPSSSRSRVVRQLLAESLGIATAAAILGLVLAAWAKDLGALFGLQFQVDVPIDGRVLAFACAVVLFTSVLAGLAPALRVSGVDVAGVLKAGGLAHGRSRWRETWSVRSTRGCRW